MKSKSLITGQHIRQEKLVRARELRLQMTPSEALLWEQLRASRFHGNKFRRQQLIDGFIVDFYCHAAHLVIEVDGLIHTNQQEHDTERDAILSKRDLRVLRITNDEVNRDMNSVLLKIQGAIAINV